MKLWVHVLEASGLAAGDSSGCKGTYVRVRLGKQHKKTRLINKTSTPNWDQEFSFKVGDLNQILNVKVYGGDSLFSEDLLGRVKFPLSIIFDANSHSLAPAWYPLQHKSEKSKKKDSGEIRLSMCLSQKNSLPCERPIISSTSSDNPLSSSDRSGELNSLSLSPSIGHIESSSKLGDEVDTEALSNESLVDLFVHIFLGKNFDVASSTSGNPDSSAIQILPMKSYSCGEEADTVSSSLSLNELLRIMESKDQGGELPDTLPGGVLIDQSYLVAADDLNSLIFSPSSKFSQSMAELQGIRDLESEPWRIENNGETLRRVLSYTNPATKLTKAAKATEEQTYLKCGGNCYAVLAIVSIPDLPYGSCFKTEILYSISAGPVLPSEEQCSRLVVSWRMNFVQSTMMKGLIENGARQGLKESYALFAQIIGQNFKPFELKDNTYNREHILAGLQTIHESDSKLAYRFFGNFTAISSVIVGIYVVLHILLVKYGKLKGLEFAGIDLPDSLEEVIICGVLVLQGHRLVNMIQRFWQARRQKGSDHGVKAQGTGWLLTVALIEGSGLEAADSSGLSDPYVVFTCNSKTKTSSIKFQTNDPQWNEIFEFDAMNEPPSVLNVDVYDFDGPFDEAISLGHAEVNFVKSNISALTDVWIPLQGKLAHAFRSKLHLQIFLNNNRGAEIITEYLLKMEREIGKKLNLRSPQTNSAFQKLFCLPPEEFLISDFTCHLKRKMPLQGRLFLSSRIIGFYANLFGHKTKFYFLWEDIEDIQVVPPSLASVGSPSLLIILRNGRGIDAKHGAKTVDLDGRLKFHFQSFVSFHVANRTIIALWKARSLSPEQKMQIAEVESETKCLQFEERESFLGIEDAHMSEIFSSVIPVDVNSLMDIFAGGPFELGIMEKVGCLDYTISPWEIVRPDVCQRQANYKFNKVLSRYGGEVTSSQQKTSLSDKNGWIVEEVMTLQGILLGDYFSLHLRYHIEEGSSGSGSCNVQILLGISWLKSTKHQKRISKSVISKSSVRIKEMFNQVEKELIPGK